MSNPYDIGDNVVLTDTYTDPVTKEALEPEGVIEAWARAPSGKVTELEVSEEANVATIEHVVDESGVWRFAFEWPEQEATEIAVYVRKRKVPR